MLVYMDCCCFNRPYDDQSQDKILLETEAKLKIQAMIRRGDVRLAWSYMLDYENGCNPDPTIRTAIRQWKPMARIDISETPGVLALAGELVTIGLDTKDALHVACAIEAKADCFITTDMGIVKKLRHGLRGCSVINPVLFFIEPDSRRNQDAD